jgi:hypothetical protein
MRRSARDAVRGRLAGPAACCRPPPEEARYRHRADDRDETSAPPGVVNLKPHPESIIHTTNAAGGESLTVEF